MPATRHELEQTEKRSTAKVRLTFNYRRYAAEGVVVTSIVGVTSSRTK
jgi:hypothetical protein